MFGLKVKSKNTKLNKIPKHIGIIMDGNGRWAKKRLKPRIFGHKAGMDALQEVTIAASDLGIKVLTVYAFSTENWSRPEDEVNFIMNLPVEFFDKYVPELNKNNVRIQMIGETHRLPEATLTALNNAIERTRCNSGLILNFALNYGGRAEITLAVRNIAQDVLDANLNPGDITEDMIANYLMTDHLPYLYRDPDYIIRTSGELRLSNFLPWQSAYSEFYFTPVLWPDFKQEQLIEALEEYNRRQRRFGGV
ncbi:Ditrans,polycis-undecaprenyl-diphosphate synthase ((2E,6E)-farnesyl-diphosphate specific) [Streptococcus parauberis]|uniref:Isoprenyl transferase n=1 Tax=Streptococcus parauberis KRS-02083 TaxID=1207545 RepID=A0ABN0IPW7_9STRE|nr:isoprenyl transferase [Streptococcus parauberis]AUT05266.1 Ditrans,polycis-undecaprenyl-diphosphate synthase ((2E,6E)-farnesyl-diphosphate specific) [Streptococcus parauberis]EMG24847.1 Undecaprenyl pyrophosphate synthetase [Streptococcus parauberis KRS-02083]UWV10722.1 isoprenyl transferase [Streptococcus parauberis]WEM61052.1 isoprenyl transferase [Streptococcus parauberis]WEM65408.1 isoprenyl transferase [Streptococcus parauberis]